MLLFMLPDNYLSGRVPIRRGGKWPGYPLQSFFSYLKKSISAAILHAVVHIIPHLYLIQQQTTTN